MFDLVTGVRVAAVALLLPDLLLVLRRASRRSEALWFALFLGALAALSAVVGSRRQLRERRRPAAEGERHAVGGGYLSRRPRRPCRPLVVATGWRRRRRRMVEQPRHDGYRRCRWHSRSTRCAACALRSTGARGRPTATCASPARCRWWGPPTTSWHQPQGGLRSRSPPSACWRWRPEPATSSPRATTYGHPVGGRAPCAVTRSAWSSCGTVSWPRKSASSCRAGSTASATSQLEPPTTSRTRWRW